METFIEQLMEKIYQKYQALDIPNRFTLEEIDLILKEKYSAVEKDVALADIGDDVENPIKYYVITDIHVLKNLYTTEEIIDLYTMACFSEGSLIEDEFDQIWEDVGAGKRIHIILTSVDNQYIDGFTIQGESDRLLNELCVFEGIDESDCHLGNEEFHEYLKRLIKAGYINVSN